MAIVTVSNISEAISIALDWRAMGKWDLFRGQANANWRVTSSAERVSEEGRQEAWRQFERFVGWAANEPSMASYMNEPDSIWAIAQHYGLKTLFIDFTYDPRVAAFFSTELTAPEPTSEQLAAIVCVNRSEFNDFWQAVAPALRKDNVDFVAPKFIEIDVDNLWRLQKQSGLFLWNPIFGLEGLYDFDRIVFPYAAVDSRLPDRREIYPTDQSELEKRLTHFFMNELMIAGSRALDELEIAKIEVESSEGEYEVVSWYPSGIPISAEWNESKNWNTHRIELAADVLPGVVIEVQDATTAGIAAQVAATLSESFIAQGRCKGIEIRLRPGSTLCPDAMQLIAGITRLWNGMRTLPYADIEIGISLSTLFEIYFRLGAGHRLDEIFGPDSQEVEFGASPDGRGAYSRAVVTKTALLDASNATFIDAVRASVLGPEADIALESLWKPARPWERFTFEGLRKLMVTQLIPTQVAGRVSGDSERDLRTVIFFSPTEFGVFGLP